MDGEFDQLYLYRGYLVFSFQHIIPASLYYYARSRSEIKNTVKVCKNWPHSRWTVQLRSGKSLAGIEGKDKSQVLQCLERKPF